MNRVRLILGGVALALTVTAPALAQYGGGGGATTTTTTTGTGDIDVDQHVAGATPQEASPGDPVQVTSDGGFTPGTTVEVAFVRAQQGASGLDLGSTTVGADGRIVFSFSAPDVEPGIYFVAFDLATGERVIAVVVVVSGPTTQAAAGQSTGGSGDSEALVVGTYTVPAELAALQVSAEKEAELLEAVRQGGTVQLTNGQLVAIPLPTPEVETEGSSAPLVAGFTAAGLVAAGLAGRRIRRTRTA